MSNPYAYRRTTRTKAPRNNPEEQFQASLVQYLELALYDTEVEWGATLNGAHLGFKQREKMIATGMRPGALDLYFVISQRTKWAEVKAPKGYLTTDQKRFISRLHPSDYGGVWKTLEDAVAALEGWGVRLRPVNLSAHLIRFPT